MRDDDDFILDPTDAVIFLEMTEKGIPVARDDTVVYETIEMPTDIPPLDIENTDDITLSRMYRETKAALRQTGHSFAHNPQETEVQDLQARLLALLTELKRRHPNGN